MPQFTAGLCGNVNLLAEQDLLPMLDKISWLHISDFHFRAGGDGFSQEVSCDALARDIPLRLSDEFPLQFIVVTGDIAFSGKTSEYEIASTFLASLLDKLGLDTGRLCIAPGNHDVDRDIQSYMYDGIRSRLDSHWEVDRFLGLENERSQLLERQSAFREFRQGLLVDAPDARETKEGLALIRRFDFDGFRVCVLELNSAWVCGDKDRPGSLLVGERQIINAVEAAEEFNPHFTVALTHHPTDWLAEFDRITYSNRLIPQVDVFHSGHIHMHQASIMLIPGSRCLHSAAGSSHETRHYKNAYNLLEYDVGGGTCRIRQFEYRVESGNFQELPGIEYEMPPKGEIPATPAEVANVLRETVPSAIPYSGYMASLLTGGTEEVPIKLYDETPTFASRRFRPEHQIPKVSRFLRVSNLLKVFNTVPLDQTLSSQEEAISNFTAFLDETASADTEFASMLSTREEQAHNLLELDSTEHTTFQAQYLDELANSGELEELIDTATRYIESSDVVVRIAAMRHLALAYLQQDDPDKRNEGSELASQILDEDRAECNDYLVAAVAAESIDESSLSEDIALRALDIWPSDPDLREYCRTFATQHGSQTLRERLDETGSTGQ